MNHFLVFLRKHRLRLLFLTGLLAVVETALVTHAAAQPRRKFHVWAAGDSHVPKDLAHGRESLAKAIRQSEGLLEDQPGTAPGFPWDIMVDTGDLSASQFPPTDDDGRILVRQYQALRKHYREDVYNVPGNHDAMYYDQGIGTWFQKWADPVGQHTKFSGVNASRRRFPVEGTWERYKFQAGNILFLMLADRNSAPSPVGRGKNSDHQKGGFPAGAVTRDTFNWWKEQVLQNQEKLLVTVHHHVLRSTTTRSNYGGGEGFHGHSGGVEGSSYLYFTIEDENPDHFRYTTSTPDHPGPFEVFLDQYRKQHGNAAIDCWVGGHSHAESPNQIFESKGITEQRWGVTFLQVSGLTLYHAGGVPMSRLLTFTDGSDQLDITLYVHDAPRRGRRYSLGWYAPAARTVTLRHPFKSPPPDRRPPLPVRKRTETDRPAAPVSGVTVRDGYFVLTETGKQFRPVGFNFVRLFNQQQTADHDNFSATGYDATEHETMLQRLADNGFNTVRVFINCQPGEVVKSRNSTELSSVYLDHVTDFLIRARKHRIFVILSMQRYPEIRRYLELRGQPNPQVTGGNQYTLNAGWIQAKTRYVQDFASALVRRAPDALAALFAIDLQNEVCFYPAGKPFCLSDGTFAAPNGRSYDLATQKQELADDGAIHFINTCADAIHHVVPNVLINANVFTYSAVGRTGPSDFHTDTASWRNRVPFRPLAIARSDSDMVDVHLYSETLDNYQRALESIEFKELTQLAAAEGKPLIVGEFGLFKRPFDNDSQAACRFLKAQWLPVLNRDWAGWIYWTYDSDEQPEIWNAAERDFAIFKILHDSTREHFTR